MKFFKKFTVKIDKIRVFKNNGPLFGVALATFQNISKMYKIEKVQRNLSTIFLKLFNIYFFFQNISKS